MKFATFFAFLLHSCFANVITLPKPGSCLSQVGIATIQPGCLNNSKTFTINGACCSSLFNVTLVIDATDFNALSGDCCYHCIGKGDQHAKDSMGKEVTVGPCLGRNPNSCTRRKELCDPNVCIWKGGSDQYSCQYIGTSPQIDLFTIKNSNYGANYTMGLRNSVQSITPYILDSDLPIGTIDASNCNRFLIINRRSGFSISKAIGSGGVINWVISDDTSQSKIYIDCQPYGILNYKVDIRENDFTGLCKNSIVSDPLVNTWIGNYILCGGNPLPPTLENPVNYNIQIVTTKWKNLLSELPKCKAGWILNWSNLQVAIPVGTRVPDPPNSYLQKGLYNGQLKIKYVSPGLGCGCAPNPGSTLKFKYSGNFKLEHC